LVLEGVSFAAEDLLVLLYPFLCRDKGIVILHFWVRYIVEHFVRRSPVEIVEGFMEVVVDIGEYLL